METLLTNGCYYLACDGVWVHRYAHPHATNYNLSKKRGRKKFKRQRQGEAGCYLSHLKVIKLAKKRFDKANYKLQEAILAGDNEAMQAACTQARKYSSVMILEDDNGFGIVAKNKKKATLNKVGKLFRKAMAELPQDWDTGKDFVKSSLYIKMEFNMNKNG